MGRAGCDRVGAEGHGGAELLAGCGAVHHRQHVAVRAGVHVGTAGAGAEGVTVGGADPEVELVVAVDVAALASEKPKPSHMVSPLRVQIGAVAARRARQGRTWTARMLARRGPRRRSVGRLVFSCR